MLVKTVAMPWEEGAFEYSPHCCPEAILSGLLHRRAIYRHFWAARGAACALEGTPGHGWATFDHVMAAVMPWEEGAFEYPPALHA